MKTTKLFFMAALALMTAACSNDDNDLTTPQPQKAEGITITAQLAPKTNGATTRAVSDGTNKIVAEWAENEHLAVLYEVGGTKYAADATITAVDGSGAATITFEVESGTADDTPCTLVYPAKLTDGTTTVYKDDLSGVKDAATLLAAQDGTLSAKLDVRVGEGTIQTTTPGLTVTTQPAAQFAIFKFTLQDLSAAAKSATEFKVSDGSGNVMTTVTPGSASGELYVALPVMAAGTYWFNATIDSKSYIAKATTAAATVAGKYYQSTVKMATLGDVILADGKFAAPSSTGTKVAMIAYLGNGSNCTNGLAIELNASPAYMDWSAVCSYSSYPSITGNPGTWRLPSKADWQNMFVGCAKSGDAISPDGNGIMDPIAGIKEKIGATGITALSKYCWSSTESGSKVWVVQVSLYDKPKVMARARFFEANTSDSYYVLGCLAF